MAYAATQSPRGDRVDFCKKNVGGADQAIRALVGALLVCGFFFGWFVPLWNYIILDYVALALGVILLLTALFRTCCLYSLLGVNTSGKSEDKTAGTAKKAKKGRKR